MSHATVVLVHGAFADASSYGPVIPDLLAAGMSVVAPAVPNRSLNADAAHLSARPGHDRDAGRARRPFVRLRGRHRCGHGRQRPEALVYLAGFVPDQDEPLEQLQGRFGQSDLAVPCRHTRTRRATSPCPQRSPALFAHDVDPVLGRVLAVSQRPLSAAAFGDPAAGAAWRNTPAWGVVATADRTINPDVQRFGYERAGASTTEVASSHLVMQSQPALVVDLVKTAVASVTG